VLKEKGNGMKRCTLTTNMAELKIVRFLMIFEKFLQLR